VIGFEKQAERIYDILANVARGDDSADDALPQIEDIIIAIIEQVEKEKQNV
jgi:hypothetical protein